MKLIISNNVLKKALKKIGTVVPKKAVLPALEHIMVTSDGNKLTIIATDLDVTIFYELDMNENASKNDTALINFHWLKGISDLHGDEPIYIEALKSYTTLSVSSGEFKQDASVKLKDFPTPPEIPSDETVNMIPGFVKWLNSASIFSESKNEFERWRASVYLEVINNHLILTATNAQQLFTHSFDIESELNRSMLISHTVVKALDGFNDTTLHMNKDSYAFKSEGVTIFTKIPEGSFPKYNSLIPKSDPTNCIVERIALKEMLDKAKFINPNEFTMMPQIDCIELNVKNDAGQTAKLTVPLLKGYNSNPMQILLSTTKLQQLLVQTEYETIGIGFDLPSKPVFLTNTNNLAYIGILLPYKIN